MGLFLSRYVHGLENCELIEAGVKLFVMFVCLFYFVIVFNVLFFGGGRD